MNLPCPANLGNFPTYITFLQEKYGHLQNIHLQITLAHFNSLYVVNMSSISHERLIISVIFV
jgi:hypothetical protein